MSSSKERGATEMEPTKGSPGQLHGEEHCPPKKTHEDNELGDKASAAVKVTPGHVSREEPLALPEKQPEKKTQDRKEDGANHP